MYIYIKIKKHISFVDEQKCAFVSEPLTEERFLKYYKTIMTKLNHVINQLQDRGRPMLNEEVDNLLPDFPLKTSEDLEIFNEILICILRMYASNL